MLHPVAFSLSSSLRYLSFTKHKGVDEADEHATVDAHGGRGKLAESQIVTSRLTGKTLVVEPEQRRHVLLPFSSCRT